MIEGTSAALRCGANRNHQCAPEPRNGSNIFGQHEAALCSVRWSAIT
jgi:hypothetical protein